MEVRARVENGVVHYEVYCNGRFYCSEDTKEEALKTAEGLKGG